MGRINLGRVFMGGILAGLVLVASDFVINGMILEADWNAALAALNRQAMSGSMIAVFIICDFLIGILLVWLYAAMRPRFGPGPRTAVLAGLAVWFLFLIVQVTELAMNLWPRRLVVISLAAAVVFVPLAAIAGAWQYKEEAAQG